MKAEELRIGNLVALSYATSGIFRITEISKDKCMFYNDLNKFSSGTILNYIEPILLTEEWLLKFGFEKNENGQFKVLNHSDVPILFNDDLNGWTCDGINFSINQTLYVHQLQNLIHALTGEELTIK